MWRRAECKLQRGRSKHWISGSSGPACRGVRGPARGTPTGTMASSQGKNELKFADWMATLPESIHSIPLTNLAIPGRCAEAADGALHLPRPALSAAKWELATLPEGGKLVPRGGSPARRARACEPRPSGVLQTSGDRGAASQGDCCCTGLGKQAGCTRGLGQGEASALGTALRPLPRFSSQTCGGGVGGGDFSDCGVTERGER